MADETKPKKDRLKYLKQMRENYRLAKGVKPALPWILLGIFLGIFAIFLLIGIALSNPITFILLGIPMALIPTMLYFSRTAMKAAYQQVEDQPGGAAAVANAMRGNWSVTPGVAATRNQDLVHRVVGRPGVVLLSEGPPSRVANLLTTEAKRTNRYVPDVPVHMIQVGAAEGQIPVDQLQKALGKLPNSLTPAEVTEVRRRLDALQSQPLAGMPKGPMPKSPKAARKGQRPR
jgi:Domain of unknown function (DUF4191)